MIKITLICAAGMSTSMLMKRMQDAAEKKQVETLIRAVPENQFKSLAEETDVLLLGPQVGYLLKKYKAEYEPKGLKVDVISSIDYGMMKGEKVLETALSMLEK